MGLLDVKVKCLGTLILDFSPVTMVGQSILVPVRTANHCQTYLTSYEGQLDSGLCGRVVSKTLHRIPVGKSTISNRR